MGRPRWWQDRKGAPHSRSHQCRQKLGTRPFSERFWPKSCRLLSCSRGQHGAQFLGDCKGHAVHLLGWIQPNRVRLSACSLTNCPSCNLQETLRRADPEDPGQPGAPRRKPGLPVDPWRCLDCAAGWFVGRHVAGDARRRPAHAIPGHSIRCRRGGFTAHSALRSKLVQICARGICRVCVQIVSACPSWAAARASDRRWGSMIYFLELAASMFFVFFRELNLLQGTQYLSQGWNFTKCYRCFLQCKLNLTYCN